MSDSEKPEPAAGTQKPGFNKKKLKVGGTETGDDTSTGSNEDVVESANTGRHYETALEPTQQQEAIVPPPEIKPIEEPPLEPELTRLEQQAIVAASSDIQQAEESPQQQPDITPEETRKASSDSADRNPSRDSQKGEQEPNSATNETRKVSSGSKQSGASDQKPSLQSQGSRKSIKYQNQEVSEQARKVSQASQGKKTSSGSEKGQTRKLSQESQKKKSSTSTGSNKGEGPDTSIEKNLKASSESQNKNSSTELQNGETASAEQNRKASWETQKTSSGSEKETVSPATVQNIFETSEQRKTSTESQARTPSNEPQRETVTDDRKASGGSKPSEVPANEGRKSVEGPANPETRESSALQQESRKPSSESQRQSALEKRKPSGSQPRKLSGSDLSGVARQVDDLITDAENTANGAVEGITAAEREEQRSEVQVTNAEAVNDYLREAEPNEVDMFASKEYKRDVSELPEGGERTTSDTFAEADKFMEENVLVDSAHESEASKRPTETQRAQSHQPHSPVISSPRSASTFPARTSAPIRVSAPARQVTSATECSPTLLDYAAFLDLLVENPCTNLCDRPDAWKDKGTAEAAAASGTFKSQEVPRSAGSSPRKKSSCHLPFFQWKVVKSALGYGEIPSQTSSRNITTSIAEENEEQESDEGELGNVQVQVQAEARMKSDADERQIVNSSLTETERPGTDVSENAAEPPAGQNNSVVSIRDKISRAMEQEQRPSAVATPTAPTAAVAPTAGRVSASSDTRPGEACDATVIAQQKPCKDGKDCLALDPLDLAPVDLPPIELARIKLTPLGQLDNEGKATK